MRILVTTSGAAIDSPVDPLFGRCTNFAIIDTDADSFEVMPNPAASAASGAGIMAAQFAVEQGVQAIITGNVGPNAMDVFQASDITIYGLTEGVETIAHAVEALERGELTPVAGATVQAHSQPNTANPKREQKIAELKKRAKELRQELANILDELDTLEREG